MHESSGPRPMRRAEGFLRRAELWRGHSISRMHDRCNHLAIAKPLLRHLMFIKYCIGHDDIRICAVEQGQCAAMFYAKPMVIAELRKERDQTAVRAPLPSGLGRLAVFAPSNDGYPGASRDRISLTIFASASSALRDKPTLRMSWAASLTDRPCLNARKSDVYPPSTIIAERAPPLTTCTPA